MPAFNYTDFMRKAILPLIVLCTLLTFFCVSCATAASAEEYYAIGMAYYELGKFEDAENWLNRARQADRTMVASTYNLGRIAFERQRFAEAVRHFENILKLDPDNVLALKAAAYTRIRMGDIERAEKHYAKLLSIVPESADDGYNHALVLYAMKRYGDAEAVLERYPFSIQEKKDVLLLYARSRRAQNKIEAIDNYAAYLSNNDDNKARFEYAQALEHHELYARALEEFRKTLTDTPADSADPKKSDVRFGAARVLLVAESSTNLGITELESAISEGFNDIQAVEDLLLKRTVSAANANSIRTILNNMRRTAAEAEAEQRRIEEEANLALEENLESGS